MKLSVWGTRGSLPSPRPGTARYGGNTSCVQLDTASGTTVVLDAGTGINRLGDFPPSVERVDVLLTHLHMDHILGLGFFAALFQPDL
ncbi:MAG TPA: MBL fold metallo-hydrolase, partial [Acidimicrobiia bacterium]|nr:MBL fold metallo-hydrolase [Acidimicrobiia bacterium]